MKIDTHSYNIQYSTPYSPILPLTNPLWQPQTEDFSGLSHKQLYNII